MSHSIVRALRNSAIIAWWNDCAPSFRATVRANYSSFLGGCPDCELGNDDEFIQDPSVLTYVAARYPAVIATHEDDRL